MKNRRKERIIIKKVILFVLFLCICMNGLAARKNVYAEDDKRKVLFISSYSYGWENVPLQIEGIKSVLDKTASIYYWFMDTKNTDTKQAEALLSQMGRTAAEMALEILNGTSPETLDVQQCDTYYYLNQEVLDAFNLKATFVPRDTVYINADETIWTQHRKVILGALLLLILFLLGFLWIMEDNRRRRKLIQQLQETEEALHTANAGLQASVNHTNVFYWQYDIDRDCVYNGERSIRELNMAPIMENYPECIIESGFIHEESAELYRQMHRRLKNGEKQIEADIKTVAPNGNEEWKRVRYSVMEEGDGAMHVAFGTSEDITEYKRLERIFKVSMNQNGVTPWIYEVEAKTVVRVGLPEEEGLMPYGGIIENVPETYETDESIHPDDRESLCQMYRKIADGEPSVSLVIRRYRQNGELWWSKITYTTIFDKGGKAYRAIGTTQNITKQVQAERRYLSQLKYRSHLDENALSSVRLNISKNKCFDQITKYEAAKYATEEGTIDQMMTRVARLIPEPAMSSEFLSIFNKKNLKEKFLSGITTLSYNHLCKGFRQKPIWISSQMNMMRNPLDGDIEGVFYAYDITEETLKDKLYKRIIWNDYELLAYMDLDYDFMKVMDSRGDKSVLPPNPEGSYTQNTQKFIEDVVVESEKEECRKAFSIDTIEEKLAEAEVYAYLYPVVQNGEIHRKRLQYFWLDRKQKLIGICRTDVTEEFEEEQTKNQILLEALDEAERANSAKTDFLSRMSHDIRTPMNAILGLSNLAMSDLQKPDVMKDHIEKISTAGGYLLNLINDILDMTKIESQKLELRPEPFSVKQCMDNILTMMQPRLDEKQIQFIFEENDAARAVVLVDPMRYQQILLNLVSNAVKFTGEYGTIELRVRELSRTENEIELECVLRDTGIGMSEEFLKHVFEPFTQAESSISRNYVGTGLGLAIVKNLIELMGGTITVESKLNEGSAFTLRYKAPLAKERKAGSQEKATGEKAEIPHVLFQDKRVLVAEDNDINYEIAEAFLSRVGIISERAKNGKYAVEQVKQHGERYYDAILMDIRMPEMDGLDATVKIRELDMEYAKLVPIIAMTANAFEEDIQCSLEAGMNAHLSKPINEMHLYETLKWYLK